VRIGTIAGTIGILVGGLSLAFPGVAPAAQTIGQTDTPFGCTSDDSYVQKALVSGTSYSPSAYGVITSWSAIAGGDPNQVEKLLVLRPDSATHFTAVAKDVARTFTSLNVLNTFTGVRLPIEPSQRLGLYLPPGSNGPCSFTTANAGDQLGSNPVVPAGDPPIGVSMDYSFTDPNTRLSAQAVVEPDADRDVFGDETQDKCVGTPGSANGCPSTVTINKLKQKGDTKVQVTATVPGAGTLQVGSASDKALAGKAAKSLKAVKKTLTGTTKQKVKLTVKLTKSSIGRLEDVGKLTLKVKAVYTPEGGPPGSKKKKAKLTT
jgi:hypothetical protein